MISSTHQQVLFLTTLLAAATAQATYPHPLVSSLTLESCNYPGNLSEINELKVRHDAHFKEIDYSIDANYSKFSENSVCANALIPRSYESDLPSYWSQEEEKAHVLVMILLPIIMPLVVLHFILKVEC